MKGMILKDIYNIARNARSMAVIFLIYAAIFIPNTGAAGYVVMCTLLCSMMIASTFSYDDMCHWPRYAAVMPVSRREIVAAKYLTLAIFCLAGMAVGTAVGAAGELILHHRTDLPTLLVTALCAWGISYLHGSLSILLTLKFGTERARMLLIAALAILAAAGGAVYGLYHMLGLALTENQFAVALCCLPILAIGIGFGLFQISARIFRKQAL